MLTQIWYKILSWLYINRKNIYAVALKYKNSANIDGKLELKELVELVKIIQNSGLKVWKDKEIAVWGDYDTDTKLLAKPDNTYKILQQYRQIWPTCAIYSTGRVITYNTGIEFTQNQIEEVAQLAREKGLLDDNGMTFIDAGAVWAEYLNDKIEMHRVPMFSQNFNILVEKWYSYVTGGAITNSFFFEREDDGKVDITKIDWEDETRYYHAWSGESDIQFTDNFAGAINYNRFINEYHQKFIIQGLFFSWAYFYTLKEEKKDYETIERENEILRRRADEVDELAHKILKANKPNDY